jgi:ACS family D-galactonate transporter-like MFS transporter
MSTLTATPPTGVRRLWDRQLPHYPDTNRRMAYLAITVAATITLYYELYIQGAVATKIISHFGFTFTQFVFVLVIGNALGAFASLAAGLADRWGRANLVVGGLLLTGLIIEFGLPNASTQAEYTVLFALLSIVEGICLVATPALIRDFSPQLGRGAAMAFWTMGPVLGSLVVTEVSSHTLASHPAYAYQFRVCGIVGLILWAVTLVGLRELSPKLRDQLMVSIRDRALIEARAAGLEPERLLKNHWRQMLRLDVIGPALGISVFLLLYYMFVAFLVVFFVTVFGYTEAKANNLGNWYWIANAVALLVAGLLSDRLRVRKPFMMIGAVLSLIGIGLFATTTTDSSTSYHHFAWLFVLIAVGSGCAYVSWMAAFTETVEKHNPAATATGLAVWGWILRIVVTFGFAILPAVVPATNTLVNKGPRVQQIVATYPAQVKVLQTVAPTTLAALNKNANDTAAQAAAVSQLAGVPVATVVKTATLSATDAKQLVTAAALSPATKAALAATPTNTAVLTAAVGEIATKLGIAPAAAQAQLLALSKVPVADLTFLTVNGPKVQKGAAQLKSISSVPAADLAYLQANAAVVAKAQKDNPGQWQTYWWICFAGEIVFIALAWRLTGHWSPRKAREEEEAHERWVQQELSRLHAAEAEAARPVPTAVPV